MPKSDDLKNRLEELFTATAAAAADAAAPTAPAPAAAPAAVEAAAPAAAVELDEQTAASFRSAFHHIAMPAVITGLDGRFRLANEAFCSLLGYTWDELSGRGFQSLTHPDDLLIGGDAMRAMLGGVQRSARIEKRYLHHDGHSIWVELNITLIGDPQGRPQHFMTFVLDTSHQHQTSALLEKRARELNCLNDIGHKIDERPSTADFLAWVCQRIPAAFQHPQICLAAVEYAGQVYGDRRALELPSKAVGGLRISGAAGAQELLGWLHVAYTEQTDFVDAESALLGSIVSRVAGYLETQRLLDQSAAALRSARRRAEELTVLNELGQATASVLDLDTLLQQIYRYVSRLMDATDFYVAMYDARANMVSFPLAYINGQVYETPTRVYGDGGLTDYVIRTGQTLVLNDNVLDRMAGLGIDFVRLADDDVPLCWVGVPVVYDRQVLGVISLQSVKTADAYQQAELDVLNGIAQQVAKAMVLAVQAQQTQEALQHAQERAAQLAAVAEISTAMAAALEVQPVLQAVVDLTRERFNLYHAHIYLLDERSRRLVLAAGAGEVGRRMVAAGWELDAAGEQSLVARAVRQRAGVIVNDVRAAPDFLPNELLPETRSEMAVPLLVGEQALGVLDVQSDRLDAFTQEDVFVLTTLASQAAVNLQNARRYEEIRSSERMVRTLIDATPDWVFIKDLQHRYLLVNRSYADMIGFPVEWFPGKGDLDCGFAREVVMGDPEQGIQGWYWDDQRVLDTGEALTVTAEKNILNGELRYFDVYKAPLRDTQGRIFAMLGFARDVTARQKLLEEAEQEAQTMTALNELSRELSTSLEPGLMMDAVYFFTQRLMPVESFLVALYDDASGTIDYPVAYDSDGMLSLPRRALANGLTDHIIRSGAPLLLSRDVMDGVQALGIDALPIGNNRPAQSWLGVPMLYGIRVMGVIVVQSTATPGLYTERERDLLQAIANQASSALANAEQYRRVQTALTDVRQSQELMRRIIDATPDWIFIKDCDHRYRLANQGYANALHIPVEAFIGKTDLDLGFPEQLVLGDPQQGIRGFWTDDDLVFSTRQTQVYPNDPATIDGQVHIFHTVKAPLFDEQGQPWAVLAFSRDVTERETVLSQTRRQALYLSSLNEVAAEMNQAADEREIYAIAGRFAARVPHFEIASIAVLNADDQALDMYVIDPATQQLRPMGARLPLSGSAVGRAMQENRLIAWPEEAPLQSIFEQPMLERMGARAVMSVPLLVGGQAGGALTVASREANNFDESEKNLLRQVAGLAGSALQSSRLQAEMLERVRELTGLQRMMSRDAWASYQAQGVGGAQGYLYDRVNLLPLAGDELPEPAGPPTNGGRTAAAALSVRGEAIGLLGVQPGPGRVLAPDEEAFLEAVSEQVAQALERARLMEQTQKSAVELQAVAEVSTATATILDPQELLQQVVDLAKQRFGLYHAHVYLLDPQSQVLNLAVGAGNVGQRMTAEGWAIPLDSPDSLVASVAHNRQGRILNDVHSAPGYLPNPLLPDTLSELAVPMTIANTLLGVFDVQADTLNRFTDEDLRTYATLASQAAVALQNARLYAEQLATVERLRELDNMKSAFLANMSHELRTPLNSILGFTQVIVEGLDGPLTDLMVSDLELIEKNGKHLLNLINDVLDMAKIEAGRLTLSPEPVNLYDMVDEVIMTNAALARDKNLYMDLNADPVGDWIVMADHVRIRQILINLMGNSIKFTDHGGITVELERFGVSEADARIQVRIRDTGIGVPQDKLEDIFEAFSQVDSSTTRKAGGTGLGLPISRRLVEMHGGRLWAESGGSGKGSVFLLELPVIYIPVS
ncbi:MAG: GAF domain-containing protein [Chloroflexota bacterium]